MVNISVYIGLILFMNNYTLKKVRLGHIYVFIIFFQCVNKSAE